MMFSLLIFHPACQEGWLVHNIKDFVSWDLYTLPAVEYETPIDIFACN